MKRWISLIALTASALLGVHPSTASALSSAGPAEVVDANGQVLTSGTSETQFTLRLPEGAECQGDSQDGGYRVQSFFVPPTFDPGSLTYGFDAPDGEGNQPLWDIFTNPYMQGLTGVAREKGGPGAIANTPMFSFAVYAPRLDLIPSGRYRVGLACTLDKKTTRYWSTEMRVMTEANAIAWRVVTPAAGAKKSGDFPLLVLLVPAALLGGVVVWRRRSS